MRAAAQSHEGHQVDAIEAVTKCGADVYNMPLAVLLFYSHRWRRPNWCETLQKDVPWSDPERQRVMGEGHQFGDPDDAEHSKARALIEYAAWFKRKQMSGIGTMNGKNIPGIAADENLEIFWWIDWACTDQDNPGPDMAALPAFAAVCAGMVAAWSDEYAGRAWCQVEMLMSYAFITTGNRLFVVPDGFDRGATRSIEANYEAITVPNPAQGHLTNDMDRPVIESLTRAAESSQAFSCWRVFVKESTTSCLWCVCCNVCLCCQCCGQVALSESRTVRPGQSKVMKVVPVDDAAAPTNARMDRGARRVAPA